MSAIRVLSISSRSSSVKAARAVRRSRTSSMCESRRTCTRPGADIINASARSKSLPTTSSITSDYASSLIGQSLTARQEHLQLGAGVSARRARQRLNLTRPIRMPRLNPSRRNQLAETRHIHPLNGAIDIQHEPILIRRLVLRDHQLTHNLRLHNRNRNRRRRRNRSRNRLVSRVDPEFASVANEATLRYCSRDDWITTALPDRTPESASRHAPPRLARR